MEIQNPAQQSQQDIIEPTAKSIIDLHIEPNAQQTEKEFVNSPSFNLYHGKISLYEDLLVYITSWGMQLVA